MSLRSTYRRWCPGKPPLPTPARGRLVAPRRRRWLSPWTTLSGGGSLCFWPGRGRACMQDPLPGPSPGARSGPPSYVGVTFHTFGMLGWSSELRPSPVILLLNVRCRQIRFLVSSISRNVRGRVSLCSCFHFCMVLWVVRLCLLRYFIGRKNSDITARCHYGAVYMI